jgi:hypothetical protein
MTYSGLIWKNTLRNKRRSVLTALSLAASLFLLTTLRTVLAELQAVSAAPLSELRLVSRHVVSFTNPLPISYLEKMKRSQMRDGCRGTGMAESTRMKGFFAPFTVDQRFRHHAGASVARAEGRFATRNAAIAGPAI